MNYKNLYTISLIVVCTLLIGIVINQYTEKKYISNSLLLFWDIYCKTAILDYINKLDYLVISIPHREKIGDIIKVGSNYYCLMNKHPQEYSNISILLDEITKTCKYLRVDSLIGISTAGSDHYSVGRVLQFNSAIIENYREYSLQSSYVEGKKILYKTSEFISQPIINTKRLISPTNSQVASGEDEFVTYLVSNKLNIFSLTLTGISNNKNLNMYKDGGGKIAAKNIIHFLFSQFILL
uniref:Nucleoside phosphorylase domain-containing protein n=1 Tax=viral metagenome TaxID=1070528 RepID=A0A6C0BBY8_9ZZZZ